MTVESRIPTFEVPILVNLCLFETIRAIYLAFLGFGKIVGGIMECS